MVRRVALQWSGGKDSAMALCRLRANPDVRVDRLVTTVEPSGDVSTAHRIDLGLLRAQAAALGLPLQAVTMPGEGLGGYATAMTAAAERMREDGIEAIASGDLAAAGARGHREAVFGPAGLDVLEPLAGLSSAACIEAYLRSGWRAATVVVDAAVLGPREVGVPVDRDFLARLPAGADPCGETGEYHTFVYGGPLFTGSLDVEFGTPRRVEHTIGTTDGPRRYAYWVAAPRLASSPAGG